MPPMMKRRTRNGSMKEKEKGIGKEKDAKERIRTRKNVKEKIRERSPTNRSQSLGHHRNTSLSRVFV